MTSKLKRSSQWSLLIFIGKNRLQILLTSDDSEMCQMCHFPLPIIWCLSVAQHACLYYMSETYTTHTPIRRIMQFDVMLGKISCQSNS